MQFAVQTGYLATTFGLDRLRFASEMLSSAPVVMPSELENIRISQFDVNVGVVGYTPYLYFGLAVHRLLPMKKNFFINSNNRWTPKWTAHIGGKITITEKTRHEISFGDVSLYPNIIFISQETFHYMHEGFYFKIYPFTIGTWIRHNFKNIEAFIVTCGIEYKNFKIGYSYDFNLTKLERTGGSHEVSLQFILPCSTKTKKSTRTIPPVDCPKF
jgi:type IX secretion system PorP/SprF family membrane protein